ncbi:MAG: bifunctional ADP-dependent NAD(P)H-hydrate dehydratase/NAD(P)H-hydrate epimerase [Dermatophilaceae bacterium]
MIQAYAIADVRDVENAAMAQLAPGELMERASRGLAEVVGARLDDIGGSRVVALVGGGNNGGDALYAVAWLAALGVEVGAVTTTTGTVHPGAEATAADLGVTIVPGDASGWRGLLAQADVVIDGITGIGGRAGLREEGRLWVEAVPEDAYVVAVDLPSGTDPAGEVRSGMAVVADETVTFGAAKPVHLLPAGEPATGRLTIVDIGLDFEGVVPAVERLGHDDVASLWPLPTAADHKYSRGVVGLVTGSTAYPGAAVLSVLGALGTGPGMIRYLGPDAVQGLVHQHAPEVVTAAGTVQAWVVGSGVDPADPAGADQVERIGAALGSDLPVVVDAGALTLVARRDPPTVLTPHAGELAALLQRLGVRPEGVDVVTRDTVTAAPVRHARAAADALDAVVLLKGSTTLVVPPARSARPVRSQTDAPPWLATAGAGDVLGGVIGTLLAAGLDCVDAASLGALVHGVAAHQANPGGPLRARAVAEHLPAAIAGLLGAR